MIGPLREGILEYKTIVSSKSPEIRRQRGELKIYNLVRVVTFDVGRNGFCYKLKVEFPNRGRRIDWEVSKRLIFGSLVCLSTDNFETMEFAVVISKDNMANGILVVKFCNTELNTVNLLGKEFKMTESPAYYEAYRHVLKSIQLIGCDEFPFTNYIVHCDSDVKHPSYMQKQTCDLRPLVDKNSHLRQISFSQNSKAAQKIDVLSPIAWPTASVLHMDEFQLSAVQHALSREFAIIQGPPGTGKTYVGLKVMKALLHNKPALTKAKSADALRDKPLLVVCYTNHALDQFLEGIAEFYGGKIVRVGGRYNESVKRFALKELRKGKRYVTRQLKDRIIAEIEQMTNAIYDLCIKSELYQSVVLSETCLKTVMNDKHYQSLYNAADKSGLDGSVTCTWLGLSNVNTGNSTNQIDDKMENKTDFVEIDTGDRELLEDVLPFLKPDKKRREILFAQIKGDVQDSYVQSLRNNEIELMEAITDIQQQLETVQQLGHKFKRFRKTEDELRNDLSELESELEQRIHFRMNFEVIAKRVIRGPDIMLVENADKVKDVWKLDLEQRRRLYRLWVHKLVLEVLDGIDELKSKFVVLSKRYEEVASQEDKLIMEEADVIGMTTTCAARYQSVLKEIRPEIIIVEEAAEVLESHIVTSLNHRCKHLVLIGDHKQLRPNPAVYKLAQKYNMDVSLFERMIRNDIPYSCLQLQHRMRPEIANIMRFIYPQLKDHPDVKYFDDIKGIKGNLLFVNHKTHERQNDGIKSYSNVFEAQFAAKLCKYLLMQGYSASQITILTTYTGQLIEIQNNMPRGQFSNVRVTVVDNFQGEENDIIILSLVRSNTENKIGFLKTENRICVALSRAKKGFYILGNFDHLAAHSQLWMKIKLYAQENGYISNRIGMYCQNHPEDAGYDAARVEDFLKSPEGGCQKKCEFRLECGHVCKRYCHVLDSSHEAYKCQEDCTLYCERRHPCKARCYKNPCPPCEVKVKMQIPRCGHTQSVPCYIRPEEWVCEVTPCPSTLECGHPCKERCGDSHTARCRETIKYTWRCGHTASIQCWQKEIKTCPIKCDFILKCGHMCSGTCGSCFQGRFHDQCTHKCARILICGHKCQDSCSNCPPCTEPCENRCIHSKCPKACGEPCKPCKEHCPWKCEHFKCTKRCSEPCNRPPCNHPCKEIIPCGHKCIGLCGEPCPDKCRHCDKDEVTAILFGNEEDDNARFIQLEDCRHIIESKALDKYIGQSDGSDNIGLKVCPRCKTVIRKSVRYGQQINKTLKDIEQVKKSIIGDAKTRRTFLEELLAGDTVIKKYFGYTFPFEADRIQKRQGRHRNSGTLVSQNALETIKCQFDLVKELVRSRSNIIENKLSKADTNKEDWLETVIKKISRQRKFISEQEISDVRAECYSAKVFVEYLRMKKNLTSIELSKRAEVRSDLNKLRDEVATEEPMKEAKVDRIKEILNRLKEKMKCEGLGIDEDEKMQIINAVGLKQGHWFKCPNGHVYAIGECGGATQRGTCPECKAEIGGECHRLAEGNRLAAEMDGARHAAYSEDANNLMNFDLNNLH